MKRSFAFLLSLLMAGTLVACGRANTLAEPNSSKTEQPAGSVSQEDPDAGSEAYGTTEVFRYGDLCLSVTNVFGIYPQETTREDGSNGVVTTFVVAAGAEFTVLDADMDTETLDADGQPTPWWFIMRSLDDMTPLTDELAAQRTAFPADSFIVDADGDTLLAFEIADPPQNPSGVPYDLSGDGVLQCWEFPVPTGESFGLEGADAALYTAVASARADAMIPLLSGTNTTLMLTSLRVFGQYEGENGETNYVCGLGEQFYYDMGDGLANAQQPPYTSAGGGGNPVCVTIAADGTLADIQETYDGDDNTARIKELCGPLTDLADALNSGEDFPVRELAPSGDALLKMYLNHYFPEYA